MKWATAWNNLLQCKLLKCWSQRHVEIILTPTSDRWWSSVWSQLQRKTINTSWECKLLLNLKSFGTNQIVWCAFSMRHTCYWKHKWPIFLVYCIIAHVTQAILKLWISVKSTLKAMDKEPKDWCFQWTGLGIYRIKCFYLYLEMKTPQTHLLSFQRLCKCHKRH